MGGTARHGKSTEPRQAVRLGEHEPTPTGPFGQHLRAVVRSASAGPPGEPWSSALPCRRHLDQRHCPGYLTLSRTEDPAHITWRCDTCDDRGVVVDWVASGWDLGRGRAARTAITELAVPLRTATVLRDVSSWDRDYERIACAARRVGAATVVLTIDTDLLGAFLQGLADAARQEPHPRQRRRLQIALGAVTAAQRDTTSSSS